MDGSNLVDLLGRWATGRGPLYLLLTARLRALIDDGVLPPGGTLPPDRQLARRLAVGRGTVVAAYDLLQQEGRVVRRQGSGTRVAPAQLPAVRSADGVIANPLLQHILHPPDNVQLLTCAAPDVPPPELAAAYQEALTLLPARDLGYQPAGQLLLRQAVAAYYTGRGLPTTPDEIIVTTGAQQALTLLSGLLLTPGATVRTDSPTYPGALEVFRQAAAVVTTAPRERPALVYAIPTASNPGGAIMSNADRRRLTAYAVANDVPLIDDEVCAELVFSGETPPPLAAFAAGRAEHVITIASLSKVVWGGLRVGWIRAAAPLVSRLARLRAIQDLGGEVLGQLAAAVLLRRIEPVRRARVAMLAERHDHLAAELRAKLPTWTFDRAEGGQTIWVRLPHGDADAFSQVALRHGVAIPPGRAFDPHGGHADHLRLHFLFPPAELTRAVDALAAAWAAYDGTPHPASRHTLIV
ncbi:PLP-dependent aminotransferase family protein [Nonomuraea sp. NBC_01738]|uniref:aminotransferase-like domain-containing protein n=1 Tax=Nonomuraea sp. NBC_01738 TaxID=2976003 RepID=UPI002E118BCC|nr:PLP-dependent aminotransferase family protein [Nonomuraea sp. NBC_01738]